MDTFITKVIFDINDLRADPKNIVKRFEIVKKFASRFKNDKSDALIKEIDKFEEILTHAKSNSPLIFSNGLQRLASKILQEYGEGKPIKLSDKVLKEKAEEFFQGHTKIYQIGEEDAENLDDVILKLCLDINDKAKLTRTALMDPFYKFIGVAYKEKGDQFAVVIIVADNVIELIEDVEEIKQAFDNFDLNKTGKIDPKETIEAMKSLGYDLTNPSLYKILLELDTPENMSECGVNFEKFKAHFNERISDIQSKDGLRRIFQLYVEDEKQDTITLSSFRKILRDLNEDITDPEIKHLIGTAPSGLELSFDEFYDFMTLTPEKI